MNSAYYWSPCLNKGGTYKATINSAISLAKYSKNNFSVKLINVCGEWENEKEFLIKNNVDVINLGLNYFKFLPKTGYFKSIFTRSGNYRRERYSCSYSIFGGRYR